MCCSINFGDVTILHLANNVLPAFTNIGVLYCNVLVTETNCNSGKVEEKWEWVYGEYQYSISHT